MTFCGYLPYSGPPMVVEHEISLKFTTSPSPNDSEVYDNIRTPHVPASGIPIEMVLTIFEAAYFDDRGGPDIDLLSKCTLVCKAWSLHAQKLLFRRVRLRSHSAFASFTHAVNRSSPRGQILGDAVIQMHAVLDYNQPGCLDQSSLTVAVANCPNLYELDLAQYGCVAPGKDVVGSPAQERMRRPAPSFDEHSLALLSAGPRITALNFSNWSENNQSVLQLLEVWPSLKSLSITGTSPVLSPDVTYPPFPCALEELRLNCQREPAKEFLGWLLHRSAEEKSLRVIDLERQPSPELLDFLVEKHGETLHSLAVPSFAMHEHAHAAMRCRSLRELRTESSWSSPVICRQMPETIQHLAFGLDLDTLLNPIIDLVKTRDDLQAVTVNIWRDGHRHPQLASLQMTCAYRGVDLRLTRDVRRMRLLVRGDPVVPPTYPRTQTLDSMQPAVRPVFVA
ncbi:uncharacterized protein BJ212DRAFT_1364751 [Suillus subaureus]|uniref:F-box domain-containing protein n=1 Tax=Suillus subaureus TaxID=48587 RepID=A0A9P7E8Q6_9AGAM|nr:uncharacterized protein BJ212DRAFT_1364751 [Suillus subaureus]KAG1813961.1 hypothetical protein BJ212DRAFT_1364751 [Suillus subaureus]